MDEDLARRIEDYRFGNRIGSESEALRRLIAKGLENVERQRLSEADT